MAAVASETFTATSAPIQYAAVRAFRGGVELERYLVHSRRILQGLAEWIWATLTAAGVRVARPDGAFYMFPDFDPLRDRLSRKGITMGEELCRRLLEDTGVALLPGSAFGRPEQELTARMAFVDFDGARALAAAEQMALDKEIDETFLREYCGKVLTAVELLTAWSAELC
jgi:aspartate aminotransferase